LSVAATIIGSKTKRFRLRGSIVAFTQKVLAALKVSTRVKLPMVRLAPCVVRHVAEQSDRVRLRPFAALCDARVLVHRRSATILHARSCAVGYDSAKRSCKGGERPALSEMAAESTLLF